MLTLRNVQYVLKKLKNKNLLKQFAAMNFILHEDLAFKKSRKYK